MTSVSNSVTAGINAAAANVVGNSQVNTAANAPATSAALTASSTATQAAPLPNVGASTNVAISAGAQQKLADEQTAAKASTASPEIAKAEEEDGDFESFVFGALGLDHPEEIDENGDPSYSAGQYVKAAATVGGMIAMFI
ncbi:MULTISPECIES: hypothetical protein [unclassified Shewanella]|uniref:hypothetical protein n=1 Tax=unclassified Shewanella TaxID=196818 RepID=UPI001BC718C1|nr:MULTISPECIES: hypothetical protein [unclassified Shewanella]GIU05973.1 hypothetical protein TUM4444_03180 [Shewanella sp. MBTL60-112-B1]GIU25606.1 hypothetical protein TUM4445_03940 [Shewanella sp. MBTL60-112-B2]